MSFTSQNDANMEIWKYILKITARCKRPAKQPVNMLKNLISNYHTLSDSPGRSSILAFSLRALFLVSLITICRIHDSSPTLSSGMVSTSQCRKFSIENVKLSDDDRLTCAKIQRKLYHVTAMLKWRISTVVIILHFK